jgi:DNA polymerase IV
MHLSETPSFATGREDYKWLFLDLNSYFASVEQQETPALRGKPIAVVPMMTDGTCAIAASYEAKRCGIKTGTKIFDAKRLCPQLICVLADHQKYVTYHHRILDEVIKHIPINKVWSIDELSSRLPPHTRNEENAKALAQKIKTCLRQHVGEYITCSVGLAPNGYLGKLASDMKKPDGLTAITLDELPYVMRKLQLQDLPGIGANMEKRLIKKGILSVQQFFELTPKQARAIWGSVEGERLWYNLHGFDVPPLETHTSVIGHSRILDPALRHPHAARLILRRLTVKAAARLRRKGLLAAGVAISARIEDGPKWANALHDEPVDNNTELLRRTEILWAQMMSTFRPSRLKKVAVTFYDLQEPHLITGDLFSFAAQTTASSKTKLASVKNNALSHAMDQINSKFGSETLRLGVTPQTQAGFVGTKIAFSRIPDVEEFWE